MNRDPEQGAVQRVDEEQGQDGAEEESAATMAWDGFLPRA